MKRLNHILLIIGLALSIAGCTLSLDEPSVTGEGEEPNGDGFSAPRTEQTELGEVTYQFQDGVRVINEKYVPYIVYCRNDTTLGHTEILFTKNIPGDMLPRRGEYIATTMSQLFQSTLCDEVDFVEESQGGYLLTSHGIPLSKVFKELDFSIDASIAGDYEEDDSKQSRSGDGRKLKGFRLVPRYNPLSRADDGEMSSEPLFSLSFWDGDKSKVDEFEINPAQYHKWEHTVDKLSLADRSIKRGGSSKSSATRIGLASYQNVKLKFSLQNGFDLELSNDIVQVSSFYALEADEWSACGIAGSTGMTVPADGILHKNEWKMLELAIPIPYGMPSIGLDVYVAKLCVDFNFAAAVDEAVKVKGDKAFRYEGAIKTELFKWNMKTSKDYETTVNRSKNIDVRDTNLKKELSNSMFQYASRFFLHFDLGFTLGAATMDISPLRINLDVSMTHKMDNDAGSSKPSELKATDRYYEITYSATDKSLEEWKGTLAVGVSTDMKVGAIIGDLVEYADWFKHAAASMKWAEGSMVLWRIADSVFPVMNYTQTYDQGKKSYHGTVSIPHPGKIGWFSTVDDLIKEYSELELLIYDENFNFIKAAKTSEETHNYRAYSYLRFGEDYGFDFTLDNSEIPMSKYFYVVPAFMGLRGNSGEYIIKDQPHFFAKPCKYTNHSNSGQINGVETLWVENDDKICKPGYCLDGIAMDAECFFQASSPSDVHVNVEFFDSYGRSMMAKDFTYSVGSAKGGRIKAIYLINHLIETVVDKAKVTLWYDDPYMQTSVDPTARKVILDEYEVIYDDNTEWWPVYDCADPSYWTQQGYRIGR